MYGFVASVLPVWFLLEPRDYLSTYMKLGTIATADYRRLHRSSQHSVPGGHPIYPRRRAHHQGQAFPVPLRHHCLRRNLRFPLAHLVGNNPEDAVEGNRRPLHRLRGDDVRRNCRGAGPDRSLLHVSGRLLRHQFHAGSVRQARAAHCQSRRFLAEVGEKLAGRTGGAVRSPSAWRRSSAASRA